MNDYKTPNVYIEEIPNFAPSVVAGATAVPAFIGYTERAGNKIGTSYEYNNKPVRITSMVEYENIFGTAYYPQDLLTFKLSESNSYEVKTEQSALKFLLYYQLQMYFANGGGVCYIVSVGQYNDPMITLDKKKLTSGLNELTKEDEPTLIVLVDAITLEPADYYEVCTQSLQQCEDLKDRFVILDVPIVEKLDTQGQIKAINDFRSNIGQNNLKYGAAYYPYLSTNLSYSYEDSQITDIPLVAKVEIKPSSDETAGGVTFDIIDSVLTIYIVEGRSTAEEIAASWTDWTVSNYQNYDIKIIENAGAIRINTTKQPLELMLDQANDVISVDIQSALTITKSALEMITLADLKTANSKLYSELKSYLNKLRLILPPSGAIAGIYASVDKNRGVWKAPANVSINSVLEPIIKIDDAEQSNLNVHDSGKSINVIRSFTGKGTLVWGSRTLAGNDNEWRYVPVRRLFNLVEKSIKKSTSFAVFEPNSEMTWLKVRVMIENYLNGLWSQGALAGSKAEDAYFVHVGLGKTMTAQDILEGRMIVKVGMAAVRPAEFIIMQFSHLVQKS